MPMDNTFGSLLCSIRTEKNIKAAALVRGLCDVAVLKRIENGEVLPGYLLRSALINRLGLATECHTASYMWRSFFGRRGWADICNFGR